jgi:hypothetical protein
MPQEGQNKADKKNGRPKLDDGVQRDICLTIKVNAFEKEYILINAKAANLQLSVYAREVLLGTQIKAHSQELAGALRQLYGMANNLNQLAHQANMNMMHEIEGRLRIALGEVADFIDYIRKL